MICLIALIVFGILGIFSASQRKIAAEAFDCVFRKVTFRKCTTGLDKRLKGQITGKIMSKSPRAAKLIYKHFDLISMIFTILLLASLAYSVYGMTNYIMFGNCNGPNSNGICVYDQVFGGTDYSEGDPAFCTAHEGGSEDLVTPDLSAIPEDMFIGPKDAKVTFVEFGCYACPNTQKAYDTVEKLKSEYKDQVRFLYLHFPISTHSNADRAMLAAMCTRNVGKFNEYFAGLFEENMNFADYDLIKLAIDLGMDQKEFTTCLDDPKTQEMLDKEIQIGLDSNIPGTPTFFINDQVIIGPQHIKKFKSVIDSELKK